MKASTDTVTIRQATLTDLPLLLDYRRAMAAEMDNADEVAANRMIAALEPYLRSAIAEGRWHAWIAAAAVLLKSSNGCREGWTQPRTVHGYTVCISSPRFGGVASDVG